MSSAFKLAALSLTASVSIASHAQQGPTPADEAAAARANALKDQQVQQQREAQQRGAAVQASTVRSTVPGAGVYPELPNESPCFRIEAFALDTPATLPDAVRAKGASSLPMDPFAFAREWLDHYRGQCVG